MSRERGEGEGIARAGAMDRLDRTLAEIMEADEIDPEILTTIRVALERHTEPNVRAALQALRQAIEGSTDTLAQAPSEGQAQSVEDKKREYEQATQELKDAYNVLFDEIIRKGSIYGCVPLNAEAIKRLGQRPHEILHSFMLGKRELQSQGISYPSRDTFDCQIKPNSVLVGGKRIEVVNVALSVPATDWMGGRDCPAQISFAVPLELAQRISALIDADPVNAIEIFSVVLIKAGLSESDISSLRYSTPNADIQIPRSPQAQKAIEPLLRLIGRYRRATNRLQEPSV